MTRIPLSSLIMGMNSRNASLIKVYNSAPAIRLVKSKIRSKQALQVADIAIPEKIDVVATFRGMENIPWEKLRGRDFVIKPDRGSGGSGILVLSWKRRQGQWVRGEIEYTPEQIKRHIRDILDGRYSPQNLPDRALLEERVRPYAQFFKPLSVGGLPDVRVIVFNKVPLMAMVRFPTEMSGGKANLHAGGIGVGINVASGVTTYAVQNDQLIAIHPDTALRLADLKVPRWSRILDTAVRAQQASGLGYCGVDLVVDQHGRVLVLEVNARPGLAIQIANMTGLNERVNRVRNLKVRSPEHGIRIAQELFGEVDLHRVRSGQSRRPIVHRVQEVTVSNPSIEKRSVTIKAKMDTGAWNSALSYEVARELGYGTLLDRLQKKLPVRAMPYEKAKLLLEKLQSDPFFKEITLRVITAANGATVRAFVPVQLRIGRSIINTQASLADRSAMQLTYAVIVGSNDLQGFYVDTTTPKQAVEEGEQ